MSDIVKNQQSILSKLGIQHLNPMQEEAQIAIQSSADIILLSPTGTGKTLAFLLPIIAALNENCEEVQVLILVPSRELAIQIEQVIRDLGAGFKTNAVYGGRAFSKDRIELKHRPAILIGTPGRIADHLRKEIFTTKNIKTLVLDEFDKSLEVGFEEEMREIAEALPNIEKRILTSATQLIEYPDFIKLEKPVTVNFLSDSLPNLEVKTVIASTREKLETLVDLLRCIGNHSGIIFCNFKDSIQLVSEYLFDHNIKHACFYGGMEQKDRERALIKFRNGTYHVLIATDLAARGLDIPELKYIIHYQLPHREQEFIHRNGRTARMNADGTAYVLKWKHEYLPDFIQGAAIEEIKKTDVALVSLWETIYISGGRKDKISKGDIAGLFFKQGKLNNDQLGVIEIKQDCAFVAVQASVAKQVVQLLDNSKLKQKKVRVSCI